ncbi:hypothetical protein K4039_14760 [Lyngbya sp. CCAP 1446/10]|uniref:hypothetical protein n=1 Tax=Lyngbya sp. CCAP 1446/10 TaxID=439293 RepID=UPI002238CA22|nr:hypothetical protein [Lyngbya sp. CCAP 1446/10]MCW6051314.1 hypothetical protein [Lyngbya sp. CCAP 1446/10]
MCHKNPSPFGEKKKGDRICGRKSDRLKFRNRVFVQDIRLRGKSYLKNPVSFVWGEGDRSFCQGKSDRHFRDV